jgi:hypothetical protein
VIGIGTLWPPALLPPVTRHAARQAA